MSVAPATAFDSLAATYDACWTHTRAGMLQREAVWRHIDPLVVKSTRFLDLGCGTGEDAIHFTNLGASVLATDASTEMVAQARAKGTDALVLKVEDAGKLTTTFDIVFSDFGVMNCVRDLASLREAFARLVRPRAHLALCLMGRFCLWESFYYASRGNFSKAARRWSGTTIASLGMRVYYPRAGQVRDALAPNFQLVQDIGIGIAVPPSFVPQLSTSILNRADRVDRRIAPRPWGRCIADHRLLIFRRSE